MKKLYLTVVLVSFSSSLFGSSIVEERDVVLVTAKATKSKLINDNSEKYPNAAIYPMKYMVTFKDIVVEQGSSDTYARSAKFEIETRSTHMMLKKRARVFLLIDVTDGEKHKLIDWGMVSSFACLSENLIDKKYEDNYFDIKINDASKAEKCTFIHYEHTLSTEAMFDE